MSKPETEEKAQFIIDACNQLLKATDVLSNSLNTICETLEKLPEPDQKY